MYPFRTVHYMESMYIRVQVYLSTFLEPHEGVAECPKDIVPAHNDPGWVGGGGGVFFLQHGEKMNLIDYHIHREGPEDGSTYIHILHQRMSSFFRNSEEK